MTYLLDTDTLIDILQDRGVVRQRVTEMMAAGDTLAVCSISIAELYSGLDEPQRKAWNEWLSALPYWDISFPAAMRAGEARKSALDAGRTYSVTDALIASLAREHGATVLTSNIKDYSLLQDVRVLSLRDEAA
jgi:predicted nucleic acid-binding protein